MLAQRRWSRPSLNRSLIPALLIVLFLLTAATARAASTVNADIANFAFSPNPITIKVGDTVTWTNKDTAPHDVTSQGGPFASQTLNTGATFSYTATTPGTFTYICTIHPYMVGTLIVQAASAPGIPATGGGGMAGRSAGFTLALPLYLPAALGLLGLLAVAYTLRRRHAR
jgi:plastocyanin